MVFGSFQVDVHSSMNQIPNGIGDLVATLLDCFPNNIDVHGNELPSLPSRLAIQLNEVHQQILKLIPGQSGIVIFGPLHQLGLKIHDASLLRKLLQHAQQDVQILRGNLRQFPILPLGRFLQDGLRLALCNLDQFVLQRLARPFTEPSFERRKLLPSFLQHCHFWRMWAQCIHDGFELGLLNLGGCCSSHNVFEHFLNKLPRFHNSLDLFALTVHLFGQNRLDCFLKDPWPFVGSKVLHRRSVSLHIPQLQQGCNTPAVERKGPDLTKEGLRRLIAL